MKKTLFLLSIFALSLLIAPPTKAQELPGFVVKGVAQVSAYKDFPYIPENRMKQGSGVFVDHGGCLYTNSHVAVDLDIDQPYEHIAVSITLDRGDVPEFLYRGRVIYVDQALDLAYVCPMDDDTIFTHFFERQTESQYESVPFGKEVWLMGYTADGIETITIAPGNIVGFLNQPDPVNWVGVPDLEQDLLTLYKTDALGGGGVSGGLLIDNDLKLLGVPFAGSFTSGAFIFALSDKVYLQFENRLRLFLHSENLVPSDCVFDQGTQYYYRSGLAHYDNQCSFPFDEIAEHEVRTTYQVFCHEDISSQRLVEAIKISKKFGDYSRWSDNLTLVCSSEQTLIGIKVDTQLTAGEFAYGKARLNSLEAEQGLARELKGVIDSKFPGVKIHSDDWSTIVNSYVYGNYPVDAIIKAVEIGGATVHPAIPFEIWQNTEDYIKNMS